MTKELTDREIIKLQYNATRHLRDAMVEIRNRAEDNLRYASKIGFKPNRCVEECLRISTQALSWLDIQGAKVDDLKARRAPKGQRKVEEELGIEDPFVSTPKRE